METPGPKAPRNQREVSTADPLPVETDSFRLFRDVQPHRRSRQKPPVRAAPPTDPYVRHYPEMVSLLGPAWLADGRV